MRVYSLNLASYAITLGFNKFEIIEDEERVGTYYFIFDDNIEQVKNEYKKDSKLREFLEAYKFIRLKINEKRIKTIQEVDKEIVNTLNKIIAASK